MSDKIIIKVPQMGESITEGTVLLVNKKIGDFVENGGLLFELETEKVTVEVVSTVSGIVSEMFVKLNQAVKVGANMVSIEPSNQILSKPQIKPEVVVAKPSISISPSAQKIASDNNINLNQISGSGKRGGILKEDVLFDRYVITSDEDDVVEFSNDRKIAIAKAYTGAVQTTIIEKICVNKIASENIDEYLALFLKAINISLNEFSMLNALVFDDKVVFKKQIDIAINGIVIKDIDLLSCAQIKEQMYLKNIDVATINVTHEPKIFMLIPKIVDNQALSVAICRNEDSVVNVIATFDSRVINNSDAVEFLLCVKNFVENPQLMMFI
jgi:pyruvate/2-oxoglutarate dehydrogenase complex dihydrolipoamide acyltransferase (E2) component